MKKMVNLNNPDELWKWSENFLMAYAIILGIGSIILFMFGWYISGSIAAILSGWYGYRGIKMFVVDKKAKEADEKEV